MLNSNPGLSIGGAPTSSPARWLQVTRSVLDTKALPRVAHAVMNRMRSSADAVLLRRDLGVPHAAPAASIEISVRPITAADVPRILDCDAPLLSSDERWLRAARRRLLDTGRGTCFVAVTADNVPCYMQFLFGARDNGFIRRYFDGAFPQLAADEALLESAFTPEAFRGKKIMPAAMAYIAERATDLGARSVITFVGTDNTPSLKGCIRAGFQPAALVTQKWRFFKCRTETQDGDASGLLDKLRSAG